MKRGTVAGNMISLGYILIAVLACFYVVDSFVPAFHLSHANLVGASFSDSSWYTTLTQGIDTSSVVFDSVASRSILITHQNDIVYHTGYYSINGSEWIPFELQGNNFTGSWLTGNGRYSIELDPANIEEFTIPITNNYIILYSCTRTGLSWDCNNRKWQLHQFSILFE